jgi:hypothetical protein
METWLYPFRYRDRRTGRWVRARYKASIAEIGKRYAEWELTGPAEVRTPITDWFSPHGKLVTHAELLRLEEPPLMINPHLDRPPRMDRMECVLACVFLRRYVTHCARHKRYAAMQGAAVLHREVADALRASATYSGD